MSCVVVTIRINLPLRVFLVASAAVLVMRERLALARRDRSHGLDRDSHSQQHDSKKPEESSRHRRAL